MHNILIISVMKEVGQNDHGTIWPFL